MDGSSLRDDLCSARQMQPESWCCCSLSAVWSLEWLSLLIMSPLNYVTLIFKTMLSFPVYFFTSLTFPWSYRHLIRHMLSVIKQRVFDLRVDIHLFITKVFYMHFCFIVYINSHL